MGSPDWHLARALAVAIITDDTDRFVRFYEDVFDAKVSHRATIGPGTLTMVDIGPRTELNVFPARRRRPTRSRARLDVRTRADRSRRSAGRRRSGVRGDSQAPRGMWCERRVRHGFRRAHSVFFKDPDGLEGEVLLWLSGDAPTSPPGTPAAGYNSSRSI
ncbi:MAG: VOC family protein [Ilumatobacteraceae bacterium]